MTRVRGLTWAGLAVGSAVLVAVVTAATQTTPRAEPTPRPAAAAMPAPAPAATPIAVVAAATAPAIVDCAAPKVGSDEPAIETGSSTLALRLRDADSGAPVDVNFVLWRLGVPADEFWSEGDQVYARASTVAGVVRIEHLPQGRYRICVDEQRKDADDPPEFVVGLGVTEVERTVQPVRALRARLAVFDADGARVESGNLRDFGESGVDAGWCSPLWTSPREARRSGGSSRRSDWCFFFEGGGGFAELPVVATDGSFDLGKCTEPSRTHHASHDYAFEAEKRGRIYTNVGVAGTWSAEPPLTADTTFVGVAPSLTTLVAHVTSPDGSKLDPSTANIDASCRAIPCPWPPPADAWRSVAVRVEVVRDGCEPLTFDWTAATADAEHRLVAKGVAK